ncbi:MAG TPA: hypothetical protein VLY04_07895 [Bryobacteraceae bacterium]|nr:hypothetical protein [Bryobacteraceae bacterium]
MDELRGEMAGLRTELRDEMRAMGDRLVKAIRDSQTEVLRALRTVMQSNSERLAANEIEAASLKKRMAIIEERVIKIEMKLNMPPAA